VAGDIRDLATVERIAAGAGVIFHQAAMRSVPRSVADPLGANDHNVNGTLNVLEAARRAGVRRVVYASLLAAILILGTSYASVQQAFIYFQF